MTTEKLIKCNDCGVDLPFTRTLLYLRKGDPIWICIPCLIKRLKEWDWIK